MSAVVDGVALIGADGRIAALNRAAERMFGYEERELIGHPAAEVVPGRYRARLQLYLSRYLRCRWNRLMTTHELSVQRRDGSQFAAEVTLSHIHDLATPHIVVFVRDISERKHNEDAMRYSEAALHLAQELANIGNYVINFDEGADYASPQLRRIFGWEPDEPVKRLADYVEALAHWSDRQRVGQAFVHLSTGGGAFHIEYRIHHPVMGLRYLHHMAQAIYRADGRVLQHVGTVHDVTERRLVEHEIRQIQERIVHFGRISTMGEMAAAIAHEVNQPLAAIATFAQSCERLLRDDSFPREELATSLNQIAAQALRAGEVIRRVRSFSRSRETRFEHVDANHLMEELLVLAQADAHHHNVRLLLSVAPESPRVRVDTVQIQQVLLNLIHNGIEAMADIPEAEREILLSTRLTEGQVEFVVEDRGHGLDPRLLEDIFKPFFTTKGAGTGLGLAISASIVRAHGGRLKCENHPYRGARFSFLIPISVRD